MLNNLKLSCLVTFCSMSAKADLTMQEQKRRQRRRPAEEQMHDMTQMSQPMTT